MKIGVGHLRSAIGCVRITATVDIYYYRDRRIQIIDGETG